MNAYSTELQACGIGILACMSCYRRRLPHRLTPAVASRAVYSGAQDIDDETVAARSQKPLPDFELTGRHSGAIENLAMNWTD